MSSLICQNRELHEVYSRSIRGNAPLLDDCPATRSHLDPAGSVFRDSLRRCDSRQRSRSHSPAGLPRFHPTRRKHMPPRTPLPFNDPPFETLKFGNIADCKDCVYRPMRFTPQTSIHWQLNLRSRASHVGPFKHEQSLAYLRSNYLPDTDPYESGRYPGCEGSSVSMWRHLYKPGVTRASLAWETTLRGLSDIRAETSLSHQRSRSIPADSIIQSDPKLNYIYSH